MDEQKQKELAAALDALLKRTEQGEQDLDQLIVRAAELERSLGAWDTEADAVDADIDKAGEGAAQELKKIGDSLVQEPEGDI